MKFSYRQHLLRATLLLIGVFPLQGFCQQIIKGQITGPQDLPIPGVNIQIQGTQRGTTSNFEGEYQVVASAQDTLVFTYMGYAPQKVAVGEQTQINIQLQENENSLGDLVINAGYYQVKDRERTGNIAKITAEEIELQPVTNPLEALQGRMAGVEVVQQTGVPGAAPTIQIRGQNSLRNGFNNNGNLPLYIVDGMPLNSSPLYSQNPMLSNIGTDPLNTLNLSNIKSIEVLKDADATAIYGSRGANGVILITTKTGKASQGTQVSARFYSGISRVSHFVDLLHTQDYLQLRRQAFENDGVEPTEVNAKDLLLWDQNRYTNWQKELFGKTAQLNHMNLNISGGNETTSYRLGASYQKQGTVFLGDFSYEKKTFNLSVNHRSKDQKFKFHFNTNYGIDKNDLFSSNALVNSAFSLAPNAPALYNEDGSLNWENSSWTNPVAVLEGKSTAEVNNLVGNVGLEYRFTEALGFKVNLGYTHLNSEENTQQPKQVYDPALWEQIANRSQHSYITRKSWVAEPQLTYDKAWGEHHLSGLVGTTFQENTNTRLNIRGTGYSDRHLIGNLAAAESVAVNSNETSNYKYHALFARLGYNWKQLYYLNLTARRDGSSRFGSDDRFANFGAVGAAWIFSNIKDIKNKLSFLSFGKLRGSYGITGNDQIGDYRYLDTYEATPGAGGLYPTQLTNPYFSWETNKKLEAAVELGFFKDRLNLNLSWYRNRSSNQLVGYPLPAMTGFTTVEANLPATVENKGWEVELSTLNVKGEGFSWRTSFNLSLPKNKLIAFPGIEETSYQNTYRVGQPLSVALLYNYEGIDPETGFYSVEDVNQDGVYDQEDRVVTRFTGKEFYGGLQNQINYKGFSLSFLFEFVKQTGYKIYTLPPGFMGNMPAGQAEVWQQPGDTAPVQQASQSIDAILANNNAINSEFALTDASYVRLKSLSLGYEIPKKFIEPIGLKQFKLFMHAQNLFTLTDYIGLDPQMPGSISLPALQSVTGGFQLNF